MCAYQLCQQCIPSPAFAPVSSHTTPLRFQAFPKCDGSPLSPPRRKHVRALAGRHLRSLRRARADITGSLGGDDAEISSMAATVTQ